MIFIQSGADILITSIIYPFSPSHMIKSLARMIYSAPRNRRIQNDTSKNLTIGNSASKMEKKE
jgi:hypothetical protein